MKKVICSQKAPGAIGPYSQAIEANGMVFVSGQLPIDAVTGVMAEGAEAQARQSLENVKHILEEAGLSMANIVKTTVFLADMSLFADMNKVYATYFDGAFPARSAVAVKALPKDALVEIEWWLLQRLRHFRPAFSLPQCQERLLWPACRQPLHSRPP